MAGLLPQKMLITTEYFILVILEKFSAKGVNAMKSFACVSCLIVLLSVCACSHVSPINDRPMYGGAKKTIQQQQADATMIETATKQFGSREKASDAAATLGWAYLQKGDLKTAMKRFNQAWLLNPNNAKAYWGFGAVLNNQGNHNMDEAIKMTEKAYELDPSNPRIIADLAHGYAGQAHVMMFKTQRDELFHKANGLFEKASQLDPQYGYLYVQWGIALFYQDQFATAWDKIHKAEELGVLEKQIDPAFLKNLRSKLTEINK